MIYLFTGTDEHGVRRKAFAWVAAVRAKAPDAYYMRLEGDAITEGALREAVSTQGLFFSRTLVVVDTPFGNTQSASAFEAVLPELAASPNAVAVIASKLTAKQAKQLASHAEKTFTVDAKASARARGFNTALVNALASKNGLALWLELQRAYALGDAPEMLHGLLHWKARELMQKESTQPSARGWTRDEARLLSRDLILLLSDSRGKSLPLDLALERFALSLTK